MRILLTADPELPVPPKLYGGIERIIDVLVRGLRESGHTVGLVAHRDSEVLAHQVFAWPGKRSQQKVDVMRNTAALGFAARQFKPDLIHSFSRVMYLLPLLVSRVPKVMSYQRPPSARTVSYGAKLGNGSLTFTGCSEHISKRIRAAGGKAETIYNCVELKKYTFTPKVPTDAPLLFLSRIERIKGAHTAIEIARRTKRRLLIAGNHATDGEEGRYWREEIVPHLGKDGIEYVGTVDDVQKNTLLRQSSALVVPIEWDEPFGIVFAEALACGTPVISSPRGALPEIIRHGIDGFLVNSVEEACAAVEHLPLIDRYACHQRVTDYFSSTVILERYEQLYRRLAHTNGAA